MNTPGDFVASMLCVGGLDPSGGAGLSVDVTVARLLGVHPLPLATGTAVQSPEAFIRVVPADPQVVREQLHVVEDAFSLGAVKVGMLGSEDVGRELARWIRKRPRLPVVVDPVLRSSSGGTLGDAGFLAGELLPVATVVTPNLDEAAALTGLTVETRRDMEEAAAALRERGASWVLVKGGHLSRGDAADFLLGPDFSQWLVKARTVREPVRGTGCALASALAAGLARGDSVPEAANRAKRFVARAIDHSVTAGSRRVLGLGAMS